MYPGGLSQGMENVGEEPRCAPHSKPYDTPKATSVLSMNQNAASEPITCGSARLEAKAKGGITRARRAIPRAAPITAV
jgi:hypothetical protein